MTKRSTPKPASAPANAGRSAKNAAAKDPARDLAASAATPGSSPASGRRDSAAEPAGETGHGIQRLRVSDLAGRRLTRFALVPDEAARAALAEELGLLSLPRLRFEGQLEPKGRRDWHLTASLGATVVQACVATLAPVRTRIDEPIERIYSADFIQPEGEEVEMPEDDRLEPLPDVIDLAEIMTEALALALPLYPRATEDEFGEVLAAPPGAEPLTDEAVRPFAGLQGLRDLLGGGGKDENGDKG